MAYLYSHKSIIWVWLEKYAPSMLVVLCPVLSSLLRNVGLNDLQFLALLTLQSHVPTSTHPVMGVVYAVRLQTSIVNSI